jgi:hypothetical protein
VIASSEVDVMDGLDHVAPDEKAPTTVAAALAAFGAAARACRSRAPSVRLLSLPRRRPWLTCDA